MFAIVIFGFVQSRVDPDSFSSMWDGMWWATQTVTTVGYGDTVPHQTSGQVIAMILMIGGLSLFSVVTGTITSAFVSKAQKRNDAARTDPLEQKIDRLTAEVDALRESLNRDRD